ncbi:hypothetical protein PFISCL1PPCAC_9901, partial [Pristionchus fissidentatus]
FLDSLHFFFVFLPRAVTSPIAMDLADAPDKIVGIVAEIEAHITGLAKVHNFSPESIRRHYVMSTLFVGSPLSNELIVEPSTAASPMTPVTVSPRATSLIKMPNDFEEAAEEIDSELSFEHVNYAKKLELPPPLDVKREYQVSFSYVETPFVYVRPLGEKLPVMTDDVSLLPTLTPVSLSVGSPVLVQGALRNGNCILEERQRWRRGIVETNYGAAVDVRLADYGVLIKGAKAAKLRPLPIEYAAAPSVYRMSFDTTNEALVQEIRRFNLRSISIGEGEDSGEYTVVSAKAIVDASGKSL